MKDTMFFIMEAYYEVSNRKIDYQKPIKETIKWHGPYYDLKLATQEARALAMSKIDHCDHRVRITTFERDM